MPTPTLDQAVVRNLKMSSKSKEQDECICTVQCNLYCMKRRRQPQLEPGPSGDNRQYKEQAAGMSTYEEQTPPEVADLVMCTEQ